MPLIPGLILWAVITIMRLAAEKGRQIQADNERYQQTFGKSDPVRLARPLPGAAIQMTKPDSRPYSTPWQR